VFTLGKINKRGIVTPKEKGVREWREKEEMSRGTGDKGRKK